MLEHPEVAACGGDIELADHLEVPQWFHTYPGAYAVGRQGEESGYVPREQRGIWGAGMGVRKSAWQQLLDAGYQNVLVGRVGKSMVGGEEIEFAMSLQLAGWELWYESTLKLKHAIDPDRFTWRQLRKMLRSHGATLVWLDLYAHMLGVGKKKEPLSDRWQDLFYPELLKLFDRPPQAFMAWANVVGSRKALKYEIRMGYLQELFRNRKKYGTIVKGIRSAPWIKRQLSRE
jgi:hypothetical protein